MADAQRKAEGQMAQVSACAATDCAHNENKSCTADAIEVTMADGKPTCGTFSPAKPKARP